ncbi:hypothetical protein Poli38472_005955 [Pythium oligandrum]|uniref:non-specific serine/threonine protein kinase n=1 Tax=Pythium oligandrum TaxID=41045 RepID=A0A8K1CTH8_PYTOL|nr:hypothetical protein Poli38472_005955 [Pythium oligandrum]|eukprot:TMW68487.1 hypothetical protein Poli38472_005955 [Pythium oligandrum]
MTQGAVVYRDGCWVQCLGREKRHLRSGQATNKIATTVSFRSELSTLTKAQVSFPDDDTLLLSDVDFASIFPASLSAFSELKRFVCSNCKINEMPTTLFELPDLIECELPKNRINAMPVQLESSAIEILSFTENAFFDVPITAWRIPTLRRLDLSANRITQCVTPNPPEFQAQLAKNQLKSLSLRNNPLTWFDCEFPNLMELSLANTKLSTFPTVLSTYRKLVKLDLSGNPQLGVDAGARELNTSLEITSLDLSSSELSAVPKMLGMLAPRLETLKVAFNTISEASQLQTAPSLQRLTKLNADNNALSNATDVLERFPDLTSLSIVGNNITNCNMIKPQKKLEYLNLSSNAIESCNLLTPSLRVLDLGNNLLTAIPESIFELSNLENLTLSANPIEPVLLTSSQYKFLQNLTTLDADQSAFASCAVERQQWIRNLRVCVAGTKPLTTSPPDSAETASPPGSNSQDPRSTGGSPIVYLIGSFMVAVLIVLVIYRAKKPKQVREARTTVTMASPEDPPVQRETPERPPSYHRAVSSDSGKFFNGIGRPSILNSSFMSGISSNGVIRMQRPSVASSIQNQRGSWEDEQLNAWRIDYDGVSLDKRIAIGHFTEIWCATYRTDTVVVKRLVKSWGSRLLSSSARRNQFQASNVVDPSVIDDFIMEIRMLSRLNHPRVVTFYGAAWTRKDASDLMAIMEYLPNHDLHTYLVAQQRRKHKNDSEWTIDKTHVALDVAEALSYLHSVHPPVIHGNVQARNVLLDDTLEAKLGDFGSAQYARNSSESLESDTGSLDASLSATNLLDTTPWIAPEVLLGAALSDTSVDIYAFGVLLSELDTCELPYQGVAEKSKSGSKGLQDTSIRQQIAMGTLQPTFSENCPAKIRVLAEQCLAFNGANRPPITEIVFVLKEIVTDTEGASEVYENVLLESPVAVLSLPRTDGSTSDRASSVSHRTTDPRQSC